MILHETIVEAARSWKRTPYHLHGRVKGPRGGVDCVGHVAGVGQEIGAIPANYVTPIYPADVSGTLVLSECGKMLDRIEDIELGAVVAMHFKGRTVPQHLGIVGNYHAGGYSLIQALSNTSGRGFVVEHPLDALTSSRIVAIFRYRTL